MAAEPNRDDLDALMSKMKSAAAPLRATLQELHRKYAPVATGRVATYIPELAGADPGWFGISVVTADGMAFDVGDWERLFSIQSISKPFAFGLALEDHGREEVLAKVNVEPPMNSGDVPNVVSKLKEKLEGWKKDQDRKTKEVSFIQSHLPCQDVGC